MVHCSRLHLQREMRGFDLSQHVCLFPTLKISQSISAYITFSSQKKGFKLSQLIIFPLKLSSGRFSFQNLAATLMLNAITGLLSKKNAPERLNNQLKQEVIIE